MKKNEKVITKERLDIISKLLSIAYLLKKLFGL